MIAIDDKYGGGKLVDGKRNPSTSRFGESGLLRRLNSVDRAAP